MKTKLFTVSLIGMALFLASCEPKPVQPEQEKAIVETMFQCLNTTSDQCDAKLTGLGLYHVGHYAFSPFVYDSYSNLNNSSDKDYLDKILVGVTFENNIFHRVEYSRYMNNDTNPSSRYKLLSDQIAAWGYSDWHGYYDDDAEEYITPAAVEGQFPATAQIAKDRKDLCEHIKNDCLFDPNTTQYYGETFIYTHSDGSKWNGLLVIYTNAYYSGIEEGSKDKTKDISLSFSIERIQ